MRLHAHHLVPPATLLALLAAALTGLTRTLPPGLQPVASGPAAAARAAPSPAPPAAPPADLGEIRFRRPLRVLVPERAATPDRLTTRSVSDASAAALIEQFAEEHFLLVEWIPVARWQDLVPALMGGRGDLVGAHLQIREYRKRDVDHTVPVRSVREVLVVREADRIGGPRDLRGREIALRARSSFWPELNRLRHAHPGIQARVLPDGLPPEVVLQRVLNLEYDMAVLDPGPVELGRSHWAGLKDVPAFSSNGHLAFGVHPRATELRTALNDFLTREQLVRRERPRRTDDLEGIERNGVLRVLTRNNAASYFIWRGRPLGFEYELMSRFADGLGLSLEMIVADSRDQLLPMLMRGEGDVVAAGLVPTAHRRATGATFTRHYKETWDMVVTRADDDTLNGPADLEGRTVSVRRSSPAWRLVESLIEEGLDIALEAAPEELETEEIIERVANGLYDVTVADAYSVKVASTWRDDVRAAFALAGPLPVAWAVRGSNPQLLAALDAFIEREYRQVFYNVIHARYFENPRTIRAHMAERVDTRISGSRLSPFDDLVKRHADKTPFDWPLIVAVMYRESRFDPQVTSWAGARGLMQLLPVTAERFGISDLEDPESSIVAGVRMLAWLYDQFETDLSVKDRTWFTLAAYNAGLGHVLDARRLARELELDPDRWFDNVEEAMLLLSQPKYYRRARHGYVRGIDPVSYVRDIRELYNAYRSMLRS